MTKVRKVVLAYSGGLDTSVILRWLVESYGCEVIAFAADLGQGEELNEVRDKALASGASKIYIEDLREEFVRDYVWPAFRAGAIYEGQYLLGTSLARPLIAKRQVEIARAEGADALAHGATGKGNDQVRFELAYQALAPELKIIAPWREWQIRSRTELMEYARAHSIPVAATPEKPYSTDRNLLHISYEGGILEDPWAAPPEEMFVLTTDPTKAPDRPQEIVVGYEQGNPVSIDGQRMSPAEVLGRLNELGGAHGVGRVDMVENRYVGIKSRGVYETPGGSIVRAGLMALEGLCLDREVLRLRYQLGLRYSELVYYGYWFSPERELIQQLMDASARALTGEVRIKLYKGNIIVTGRRSPVSLYDPQLATFEADELYDHRDATGFIRLNALRLRTYYRSRNPEEAGGH